MAGTGQRGGTPGPLTIQRPQPPAGGTRAEEGRPRGQRARATGLPDIVGLGGAAWRCLEGEAARLGGGGETGKCLYGTWKWLHWFVGNSPSLSLPSWYDYSQCLLSLSEASQLGRQDYEVCSRQVMLSQEQQKLRCGWRRRGRLVSKVTEAVGAKFRVWPLPHRHWERPSSFPGCLNVKTGRHRSGLALLLVQILSAFSSRLWCTQVY